MDDVDEAMTCPDNQIIFWGKTRSVPRGCRANSSESMEFFYFYRFKNLLKITQNISKILGELHLFDNEEAKQKKFSDHMIRLNQGFLPMYRMSPGNVPVARKYSRCDLASFGKK